MRMKVKLQQIFNRLMLLTLLGQSIMTPVVSAVETTPPTTQMEASGGTVTDLTPSVSETDSDITVPEPEPVSPASTATEEGVAITAVTPLTEAKEVTKEDLADQNIQPVFFAASLPATTVPSELDGSKIETLKLEWLTADTTDDQKVDNLFQEWTDNSLKSVRLRISYSLSGEYDYEPGDVQIKIPRSTFENRDGKPAGNVSWAVPQAPDRSGIFEYYLEKGDENDPLDDYFIITNTRKISAASQGYIEGTIKDLRPSDIKDYRTGYIAETQAAIQVTTKNGEIIGLDSNKLTAQVDTFTRLQETRKYYSDWSQIYSSSYPAELKPANADDYIYTSWSMYTEVNDSANQPGTIRVQDIAASYENGKNAIVLGYRLNGQTVKGTGTNTVEGQVFDGFSAGSGQRHYLTVYVAYPKSDFPDLENFKSYTVSNKVTYTMTAKDDKEVSTQTASATGTIGLNRPSQIGRHYFRKENASDNLLAFARLSGNQSADLTYGLQGYYYAYAAAKKDEEGAVNPYQIVVTDDKVAFQNGTDLGQNDIEFASLRFNTPSTMNYVQYTSDGTGTFEGKDGVLYSGEIKAGSYGYVNNQDKATLPSYTVYGKTDTGDFVEMAVVNFTTGSAVIAAKNGASTQGSTLNFPANIVDYKVVIDSKTAYVSYYFNATVRIKSTDSIKKTIEQLTATQNDPSIPVTNYAKEEISLADKRLVTTNDTGVGRLRGLVSQVDLDKKLTYTNDVRNRSVRLKYTSTANFRTNATNKAMLQEYIDSGYIDEEKHTTWYDLLPMGVVPDLNTIRGRSGDTITDIQVMENFQGTGRTLLKVEMDLRPQYTYSTYSLEGRNISGMADFPQLTFEANYSWLTMKGLAQTLNNVIAYESTNDQIGNSNGYKGEPDNPLAGQNVESKDAVGTTASVMTNLNPTRETNSFIYAKDITPVVVDTYAMTSLIKEVSVNGKGLFSDGRLNENPKNVYEGGSYQYRIGVTNPIGSTTKDMIFYDFLENYKPVEDDEDINDIQWRGILQSIDLRDFTNRGVAPVVYYSTKANLNLTELSRADGDLTNKDIWTTTKPSDPRTITAIAIDARRNQDGSVFALPEGETVSAYVNMKAPYVDDIRGLNDKESYYDTSLSAGVSETGLVGGAHAYNSVKMTSVTIGTNGAETDNLLIENKYTKVGLIPYRIQVNKTWDDDNNRDGIRPDQAVIRLFMNGQDSGRSVTVNDANNWTQTFDNLDYIDNQGRRIIYSLREDTTTGYRFGIENMTQTERGIVYDVVNTHTPETISVGGTKTWVNDESEPQARPASIRVDLHADGKLLQTKTVTPNGDGEWNYTFTNLYKYQNGQEIQYTVTEPDYIEGYRSTVNGTNITNEYDPYGDLKISKTVDGLTNVNKDNTFDFVVAIKNQDGEPDTTQYDYETTDGRTGKIQTGDTIQLKHGQSVTIKRIHSRYTYEVTEKERAGYTRTSGQMTGTIRAFQTSHVDTVNTYRPTGNILLDVNKTLINRTLRAYQFVFDLYGPDGTLIRSGSNDRDGKVIFGNITYGLADVDKTYTYTIRERDFGRGGYTYDPHAEMVSVKIEDNGDGTLKVTQISDLNGANFENIYQAKGSLSLKAFKVMKNSQSLKAGAFQFELRESGKTTVIATGTNNAAGKIDFSNLNFTQADIGKTYTYIATEKAGTDATITYDTTSIRYDVEVVDNGDGTLGFNTTVTDLYTTDAANDVDTPLFVNEYKPGSLTIQKKILDGDKSKEFRFKVKLTSPDGTAINGTAQGTRTEIPKGDPNATYVLDLRMVGLGGDVLSSIQMTQPTGTFYLPEIYSNWTNTSTNQVAIPNALRQQEFSWIKDEYGGIYIYPTSQPNRAVLTDADFTNRKLTLLGTTESGGASPAHLPKTRLQAGENLFDKLTSFYHTSLSAVDNFLFPRVEAATFTPTGTVTQTGTSGTVTWEIYSDGTLYFRPTTGTTGTLRNYDYPRNYDREWDAYASQIKKIYVATGVKANEKIDRLFSGYNYNNLTEIDVTNLDVSQTKSMYSVFSDLRNVKYLDLRTWDVSNATGMVNMFAYSRALETVELGVWDARKVTGFRGMFQYTSKLTNLDVSKFQVAAAVDTAYMFYGTSNLTKLNLNHWDFSKNSAMYNMFEDSGVVELQISKWNTSKATSFYKMFAGTRRLRTLDIKNWDTSSVTNMYGMFANVNELRTLDISRWDVSKVTDRAQMFAGTSQLQNLKLSSTFNLSNTGLMNPPNNDRYAGKWIREDNAFGPYTAEELMAKYTPAMAGTWIWEKMKYKISYNANTGVGYMPDSVVFGGDSLIIPSSAYNKFGFVFKGWNTRADGRGDTYQPGEFAINLSRTHGETVTLYAMWENTDYTVAFNANTGNGTMAAQTVKVDAPYTIPSSSFFKFNYRFKEWNTLANGQGTTYKAGQSITNLASAGGSVNLYAIWEPLNNNVTIKDGEFEITLKDGEAWTLPNLPAGTAYEVYEETESGWVLVSSSGSKGVIQPNATSTASFLNDYQVGVTSYQIGGQKLLDGVGAAGYRFTLTDKTTGQVLETVTSSLGGGFSFGPLVYNQAGTHTYEIAELVGSDNSINYDTHKETVTVTVTDDGQGNLTATSSKANTAIAFNNTKKTGSLEITKQVTGSQDTSQTFDIQVQLNGGADIRTIQLTNGQSQTITDLPYGTTYQVTEVNLPAGYSLEGIDQANGTIGSDRVSVLVRNKYELSGTANLDAKKILDNTNDPNRTLKANEFTFELVDKGANATDPADDTIVATATNDEYGNIAFGAVTFTQAGNYTYYMRESKGADTSIQYDGHEEEVRVTAVDRGNGTLSVAVSYDADGAIFTNTVNPPDENPQPGAGTVTLTKTVDPLTEANKTIDFQVPVTILDKDGQTITSRFAYTSDKRDNGTIASGENLLIRHDEHIQIVNLPEGAQITVSENVPDGYSLDDNSVTTATVVEDSNQDLHLINNYSPTGGFQLKGKKTLEGADLANYQFNFLVLKDGQVIQRAKSDAQGKIHFEEISYSYEDIGKTYTYTVVEENTREKSIAYDRKEYTYTVTITDDGKGKIIATVGDYNATEATKNAPSADFTNKFLIYPSTGGMGTLIWHLSGMTLMGMAVLAYRRRREEA